MNLKDEISGDRINDTQRLNLLAMLDDVDALPTGRNRRTAPRLRYREQSVPIIITQPGGGTTTGSVPPRNLSATGISFLYWGFLHTGTQCQFTLRRRLGGTETIPATVRWCRLVSGYFHAVGAQFKRKIFPQLFVDPEQWSELSEAVDASAISGRVLAIDDQEMDRQLLKFHMSSTNADCITVGTIEEATARIATEPFDAVICDLNLGSATGEQAMRALREAGYKGPILAVTAETDPRRLKAAQNAGAAAILEKPYQPQKLLAVLSGWLSRRGGIASNSGNVIYSDLAGEPGMDAMIDQYIEQVSQFIQAIRKLSEQDDLASVRMHCQTLKGTGASYGFPLLSEAAKEAVTSLDASMSISESLMQIQRLDQIARRLASGKPMV